MTPSPTETAISPQLETTISLIRDLSRRISFQTLVTMILALTTLTVVHGVEAPLEEGTTFAEVDSVVFAEGGVDSYDDSREYYDGTTHGRTHPNP